MRIDAGHRSWILGTVVVALVAIAGYFWAVSQIPGSNIGGSTVGLWYGIAGSALMIFAGLLSAHRKLARFRWLPTRAAMLKGHLWLGLLSFVFILLHSGFRIGGLLEQLLWLAFGSILLTGLFGAYVQHTLPRQMSADLGAEVPYGQMPNICDWLCRKGDDAILVLCGFPQAEGVGAAEPRLPSPLRDSLRDVYESEVRPYLSFAESARSPFADPSYAGQFFARLERPELAVGLKELEELKSLCGWRRQIARQERLQRWLHGWMLLHIPMSAALLVLGAAHAVMSLYY